MRSAYMPLQYEKDILGENYKFFRGIHCKNNISTQNDGEDGDSEDCDHINGPVLEGDDCNIEEPPLQEDSMERAMYWESQEALLREILEQYSSSGSTLREEIVKHLELAKKMNFCDCLGPELDGCSKCLRERVVNLLCIKGFNASLRTSTWQRTESIPGGRHEYIEVVARTQGKKRKITLLIEIEFRDEFKMAKACDEYQNLIGQLPEAYIGKPEHLNAVIRVMCDAAKRSTEQKKMHMGPWRKRRFMQMKWSASEEKNFTYQAEQKDINRVLPAAVRVA